MSKRTKRAKSGNKKIKATSKHRKTRSKSVSDFDITRKAHGNKTNAKIIDTPLSNKKSVGTRATKGKIEFHYQKYANMNNFFDSILLKNLSREYFYIDLICVKNKITPIYQKDIKPSKKQFTMSVINITTNEGNHANVSLINNHNKTIEYFEPHGHRKNKQSGIGNFKGLYLKKQKVLKKIYNELLPGYEFINIVDHNRMTSFQTQIDPDRHSGFCITWCILFVHYRCLNPVILLSRLVGHLAKTFTTTKLLKYAKFIEETIKKK